MKAVILFLSCICLLPLTLEAHEEGGHHNHHISNPEEEQQRRRNNRKGRPSWDKREVLENDDTPMLQPGCKTTVSEEHKEMMARAHEEYEEQNRRHLQVFTEVTIPVRFHGMWNLLPTVHACSFDSTFSLTSYSILSFPQSSSLTRLSVIWTHWT